MYVWNIIDRLSNVLPPPVYYSVLLACVVVSYLGRCRLFQPLAFRRCRSCRVGDVICWQWQCISGSGVGGVVGGASNLHPDPGVRAVDYCSVVVRR